MRVSKEKLIELKNERSRRMEQLEVDVAQISIIPNETLAKTIKRMDSYQDFIISKVLDNEQVKEMIHQSLYINQEKFME